MNIYPYIPHSTSRPSVRGMKNSEFLTLRIGVVYLFTAPIPLYDYSGPSGYSGFHASRAGNLVEMATRRQSYVIVGSS